MYLDVYIYIYTCKYGGFHKSGHPKMDGLWGKTHEIQTKMDDLWVTTF